MESIPTHACHVAPPSRMAAARMHTSVLERALHLMPETDFVNAYGSP